MWVCGWVWSVGVSVWAGWLCVGRWAAVGVLRVLITYENITQPAPTYSHPPTPTPTITP
jgi:hypothetical protein